MKMEDGLTRQQRYYERHHNEEDFKKRKSEANHKYYESHKEKCRLNTLKWRQANREEHNRKNREAGHKLKIKALGLYGGKCENCGAISNLQFHHIYMDGEEERKSGYTHKKLYRVLANHGKREDINLLCASCHTKLHKRVKSSQGIGLH